MSAATERPCAYCGTTERPRSIHSGAAECQPCWDWRKLDGPAARHWARVGMEFLSNIDMHDALTFFPAAFGTVDPADQMIQQVTRITVHSLAGIRQHARLTEEQAAWLERQVKYAERDAYEEVEARG